MGLLLATSSRSSRPRASTRTPSASSRPRRTSPSGCSSGGSRPIAPGWRWRRSTGPSSTSRAIDYQDAYYYAEPKAKPKLGSLDEVDPEILRVYEKLGIPIEEQKVLAGVEGARKVAVDAVFDSVSRRHHLPRGAEDAPASSSSRSPRRSASIPSWCSKYLGSVVPQRDNYFACLNSAVFSDGTFVYVPEGVRCPMELSAPISASMPRIPASSSAP